MEQTAVCVVDEIGQKLAEGKVPTDPDATADWLAGKAGEIERVGMETGPLAVEDLRRHVREEGGGFARRAEEIVSGKLAAAPEIKAIVRR